MATSTPTSGAGTSRQFFGVSEPQAKMVAMVSTPSAKAMRCESRASMAFISAPGIPSRLSTPLPSGL